MSELKKLGIGAQFIIFLSIRNLIMRRSMDMIMKNARILRFFVVVASLPLFPAMSDNDIVSVIRAVLDIVG